MKNIELIIGLLEDRVDPNQYEGDIQRLVDNARKELAELEKLSIHHFGTVLRELID